jgi:hypothetical protein
MFFSWILSIRSVFRGFFYCFLFSFELFVLIRKFYNFEILFKFDFCSNSNLVISKNCADSKIVQIQYFVQIQKLFKFKICSNFFLFLLNFQKKSDFKICLDFKSCSDF